MVALNLVTTMAHKETAKQALLKQLREAGATSPQMPGSLEVDGEEAQAALAELLAAGTVKEARAGAYYLGEAAVKGSTVSVLYTGWLYENGTRGKQFDSSQDPKRPFQLKLGARQVIPGWEEGIEGMKVGGNAS